MLISVELLTKCVVITYIFGSVREKFIFGILRSLTSFGVLKTLTGSADLKKVSQNMVSFSEPSVNQTLNLRSIKHFRIV